MLGNNTFEGAPYINRYTLKQKNFTDAEIEKMEKLLPNVFDLSFVFNPQVLGKACLERLGFREAQYSAPDFNLLAALGFSENEIQAANEFICGTQTIEGAPYLKPEHYAIFDCANKCGKKGVRYIDYMAHVKMMAAVQPFLSGSISKTVNMPNHCTAEDIANIYFAAWKLGLKSIAIYRDGSKLIQPLEVFKGKKEVQLPKRRRLPPERKAIAHKFKVGNHEGYLHVGLFEEGLPGEVFVTVSKEGSTIAGLMDSFSIAISLALQYGVPLKELVNKFIHTRFEPSGWTENEQIPVATSIVDYIFRWLAYKFLPKEDLEELGLVKSSGTPSELSPITNYITAADGSEYDAKKKLNGELFSDSPVCHQCGGLMIRSGSCYVCTNCGTTSGCS
jgi:ribonucleoside-diphosphate reductase alpha chain